MATTVGRFFPYQSIHLGATGSVSTFNEASLSNSGIGPFLGQLGMIMEQDGKVYRLVQFDNGSAVAAAANQLAYWKTRASNIVTSDESAGEALRTGAAGLFLMALTDLYYGFVQIGGPCTFVTDQSVDIGDAIIATTTDGVVAGQAMGSLNSAMIGYATSDDASTTSATGQLILGYFL